MAAASLSRECVTAVRRPARARARARVHAGSRSRQRRVCSRASAFDGVSRGMERALQQLQGEAELSAANIEAPLRDVRRALLEADVSLPVARRFVKGVSERALGIGVAPGLAPDEKLIAVVHQELVKLMGGGSSGGATGIAAAATAPARGARPVVILLAGLQGVGKTTACGKLAKRLRDESEGSLRPMLVAADVYRPAAVEQLQLVGANLDVPVHIGAAGESPEAIASAALKRAQEEGRTSGDAPNVVIVDTAGRLQVDEAMMEELSRVKQAVKPDEILLVVDAMTGQEAARLVKSFDDAVGITGSVLTKMDGDTRGGAALSVFEVSGRPIKFVGTGEGMGDLEPFYPERMADRILGKGDVLTLVEKLESVAKEEDGKDLERRLLQNKYDYNDFLKQSQMLGRMGAMNKVAKLIPGMNKVDDKALNDAERQLEKSKEIISAMTDEERANPDLLVGASGPRRIQRIAKGAGVDAQAVKNLVAQFAMMRSQMLKVSSLMKEAEDKGIDAGKSAEEMMASMWSDVGEGRVKRRRGKKKNTTKKTLSFDAPKRGFGQR